MTLQISQIVRLLVGTAQSAFSDFIQSVYKWYSQEKNYLDMIFVEKLCVFGMILKRDNSSVWCFLSHILYFCKSRVMVRLVRQGKIPFVPLFIFIEEIVMKVSTTKQLICEDNDERNHWSIFQYDIREFSIARDAWHVTLCLSSAPSSTGYCETSERSGTKIVTSCLSSVTSSTTIVNGTTHLWTTWNHSILSSRVG